MMEEEQKQKVRRIGSKDEVFNGQAKQTSGGLRKEDLVLNKSGRVISKKAQEAGFKLIERIRNKALSAVEKK